MYPYFKKVREKGSEINITAPSPFPSTILFILTDKALNRFLVADQREADGGPAYNPSAEAHAELVDRIAKDPEAWPFYITFHDGTKYVDFEKGRTWN